MVAYTYSENADGTYDLNLNSRTAATTAELLKNGTLDVDNNKDNDYNYSGRVYPTLVGNSKVWDVTDASKAGDEVSKGDFVVGALKNAVIITTNDNKVLQTAWIWDYDDSKPSDDKDDPGDLRVTYDQQTVRVYNPDNATQLELARAITNELRDKGFTDITVGNTWWGNGGLTVNDSAMGTVTATDVDSGLTVRIPVEQVYRVTYNGTFVGYVGEGETIDFRTTNGDFLVNSTYGYASDGFSDVTVSGNTATFKVPSDGTSQNWRNAGSLESSANKTFAIVDAYIVRIGANVSVTMPSGRSVSDTNVVAAGTEVTVSSSLTGNQQLTATEGTKIVEIGDAGSRPSTTYKVTADVTFNVKGLANIAGSTQDVIDAVKGSKFEGVEKCVSTNVAMDVDENNHKITLSSIGTMTPLDNTASMDPQTQLSLNIFWYGNNNLSGKSDVGASEILSWYNTQHSANATKLAIVSITIGDDNLLLLVSDSSTYQTTTHSFNGVSYTIDFSGLTW